MAERAFRLPESGFEQVERILKAYRSAARGSTETPVTLAELAKRTAMNRTMISGNNAFLVSLGLIEGGNAKRLTPLGGRAALVLDHEGTPEAQEVWQEVVENSELERIVDAVRIRQGMDEDALLSHIVLTAGVPKTSRALTGARAVVDLLETAALLKERDGVYLAASGPEAVTAPPSPQALPPETEPMSVLRTSAGGGVVINVHVWVDSREADFGALADELRELLVKLTIE